MLKFIKHHLTSITGIEIYPMISFIVFFLFFAIMLAWVLKSDKLFISKMSNLPLEDANDNDKQL